MAQLVLKNDWPGFPAGTIVTLGDDGVYRDETKTLWFHASAIADHVFDFEVVGSSPVPQKAIYWFINDTGDVSSAICGDVPNDDAARIQFGNYFQTQALAEKVAAQAAGSLNRAPHGVIDGA